MQAPVAQLDRASGYGTTAVCLQTCIIGVQTMRKGGFRAAYRVPENKSHPKSHLREKSIFL